eukprot:97804-Hanusia_phi.AAC.2
MVKLSGVPERLQQIVKAGSGLYYQLLRAEKVVAGGCGVYRLEESGVWDTLGALHFASWNCAEELSEMWFQWVFSVPASEKAGVARKGMLWHDGINVLSVAVVKQSWDVVEFLLGGGLAGMTRCPCIETKASVGVHGFVRRVPRRRGGRLHRIGAILAKRGVRRHGEVFRSDPLAPSAPAAGDGGGVVFGRGVCGGWEGEAVPAALLDVAGVPGGVQDAGLDMGARPGGAEAAVPERAECAALCVAERRGCCIDGGQGGEGGWGDADAAVVCGAGRRAAAAAVEHVEAQPVPAVGDARGDSGEHHGGEVEV